VPRRRGSPDLNGPSPLPPLALGSFFCSPPGTRGKECLANAISNVPNSKEGRPFVDNARPLHSLINDAVTTRALNPYDVRAATLDVSAR
jgi:hypothetical protein